MPIPTYSKGVLLWIDDNLDLEQIESNTWVNLFGNNSDRVFRLMDLSLDTAMNYNDALDKLRDFNSYRQAGIFVYCILDLSIPKEDQGEARLQYGIALAKYLLENNISFSILSSNTGAEKKLGEEGLSAIPYYSKETQSNFRIPESLALKILSEFRRNISWVTVSGVIDHIHPDSAVKNVEKRLPKTIKYYPYFGTYRDFVDRCEYRNSQDLPKVFAIRSPRSHCHEFVQQALCVLLNQAIMMRSQPLILYGDVSSEEYLFELTKERHVSDDNVIAIMRLDREKIGIDEMTNLINQAFYRAGKTIFVIPNDESSEEISLLFRQEQITTVDELAQTRFGDLYQREELVRHCCMLPIHLWLNEQIFSSEPILLDKGCFVYPELIINPLDWRVLNENIDIPEELSDAFEIVKETNQSLDGLEKKQIVALGNLLTSLDPIPNPLLLQIGRSAIRKSKSNIKVDYWISETINYWLKNSWQYPNNFDVDRFYKTIIGGDQDDENSDIAWENNSYEILVGLIEEYNNHRKETNGHEKISKDLETALVFIKRIDGLNFIKSSISNINWTEIENSRWPYKNYPLPAAIVRRFREAGRYLWIQPEGIDIAVTLPAGRLRYRNLSFLVNKYWSTISWVVSVADELPIGWNSNIMYLMNLIAENKILQSWQDHQEQFWHALMTILRNGCPIVFITDQILKKAPLISGKDSTKNTLSSISGYGTLLGKIRGYRSQKYKDFFRLDSINYQYLTEIEKITEVQEIYDLLNTINIPDVKVSSEEIYQVIEGLLHRVKQSNAQNNLLMEQYSPGQFLKDSTDQQRQLLDSDGWYIDKEKDFGISNDNFFRYGTKIDYLWDKLDALIALNTVSYPTRYIDGYAFLSIIYDIRNKNKDSIKPNIDPIVIETIMEYFICGIEGIISQLAWCVDCFGEKKLASKLFSPWVKVKPPYDLSEGEKADLTKLMRIEKQDDGWSLYTLGITGRANKLCFYDGEQPIEYKQ